MSSSNSVIRRYTPPTCTLEIAGKNSPLSRWVGQSALKNVRFKLSFDDPRVGENQWVTVRGDRSQLQALCDAVTSYVQQFLSHSSTLANSTQQANGGNVTIAPVETEGNLAGIYLEPKGMISHELHLGTLANEESGGSIRLSAVQLADLATALDEYSADVTAIPTLNRPSWASNPPAWGKIAAASLVAVGLGTTALQMFDRQSQTAQVASNQAPSSSDQRLAVQPLPNSISPSALPLPTNSPIPLGSSLPTTTVPAPAVSPPPIPQADVPAESPQLKVTEKSPASSQSSSVPQPQLQIPTADVPASSVRVAPIPNQTGTTTAKVPAAKKSPDDPTPPGNTDAIASATSAEISRSSAPANAITAPPAALRQAPSNSSQADAVGSYVRSRWKPPEALIEQIEYRLVVAPNGTVQEIQPLGEVAGKFLDRTPIPVRGSAIAPASKAQSVIRLVLRPDGSVLAFKEGQ